MDLSRNLRYFFSDQFALLAINRKTLVDKLVKECSENIDKIKIAKITLSNHQSECKCSCTLYIVLFSKTLQSTLELVLILFTANT